MADLLIRNLDESVVAGLRKQAKASGRSVEEEARLLLMDAASPAKQIDIQAYITELRSFRETLPAMPANYSSLDALHEGRAMHFERLGKQGE
jgi:plasmid stability protein